MSEVVPTEASTETVPAIPWIRIETPSGDIKRTPLPEGDVVVGRDPSCDIVLASPEVSRRHAVLRCDGSRLHITDTSANGTGVEGKVLRKASSLIPALSPVGIGPYVLRVEVAARELEAAARRVCGTNDVSAALRREIHRRLLDNLDLVKLENDRMNRRLLGSKVRLSLESIVASMDHLLPAGTDTERLVSELADEALGLGPLEPLLGDPSVTEIMVVDPRLIYIERDGKIEHTGAKFTDDESVRAILERIVTPLGRRIDESSPLLDARLEDGSRVNAVIPPLAVRGTCITIRKFPLKRWCLDDLLRFGTLTDRMATFLRRCVVTRRNIIVSGGTGSGKTTLLNILSESIPNGERIVTIEDSAELQLHQQHLVTLEGRPANMEGRGEVTIRDLVKNAMRMRPDRIIVGECRAGEAVDMLQAMNTGHDGSMTTTHANSTFEALKRIETLALMSGLDLPSRAIREQIAASVDIIVQQVRFPDGARRVTSISEVVGLDDEGELQIREIFGYRRTHTEEDGTVCGDFYTTGYLPSFINDFIIHGLVPAQGGEYL
jgi:pilus assembly protein CpaF